MLFYLVLVVALAAISLATPPPGYVKKPDNDKDPPAYEYKYEIGDGQGRGQGKTETRSGEFASGSYYVNTGQAATDVKYFVDDWGYHPVVKYGSTDKHSSTATRFALGEHAIKALRTGGDVGPVVELSAESQKRKKVQIIQPYILGDEDPTESTPTYPTIGGDAGNPTTSVDETVQHQDSRGYSRSGENFPKESRGPSTILIPSSNPSTTPQEIAYTASTSPMPLAYAPLQEVRDIYANNDYQNAALIDEQLFLQSNAGNFGQKVDTVSAGESGIKNFKFSTTTSRVEDNFPIFSLTKKNGDVTYTVHSGVNANTAYLSSAGKNKKTQRLQNRFQYRQKFVSSSTTERPNYPRDDSSSVTFLSTTSTPASVTEEFTSNDLVAEKQEKYEYVSLGGQSSQEFSEFGPADPQLVNYGLLASGNEGPNKHQGKLETPGLSAYGRENRLKQEDEVTISTLGSFSSTPSTPSSLDFIRPIVVADVTPGYDNPDYSTISKCADDHVAPTTPASIVSTTDQAIISTDTSVVTPKYSSQNQITTSAVVLNPIQAGVALVNAGQTHLISREETKSSIQMDVDGSQSSTIGESEEGNGLNLEERINQLKEQQREHENRVQQEEQLERLKQLREEIQLQQVQQFQQELQLQQNQYEIQELQLKQQLQLQELQQQQNVQEEGNQHLQEQQKYLYRQLGDDAQLQQEVELQQVEESQQNEQLQQQQLDEVIEQSQLQEKQKIEDVGLQQVREEVTLQAQQYEARKIQEAIENQKAQLERQLHYELKDRLEKYHQERERDQTSQGLVEGASKSEDNSGIEIQKSIEIYHNEPVQEIHYPAQVPAQVESSQIDQSQGQQQYVELQSVENTQQAHRVQGLSGGGKVSFEINRAPIDEEGHILGQKDQFSLAAAEKQAQQVIVAEHQANLNQVYDLTRSNSLSQQSTANSGAVLLGFRANHDSVGRHNHQIDQHGESGIGAHGIDQQTNQHRVIFGSNVPAGAYQLNQRDQYHSHSHSHSHSYEGNRGQQQVVVGLPYTLEASKELVIPGVQTTTTQIIENPVFETHFQVPVPEYHSLGVINGVESSSESSGVGRIVEKHIPVPQPYPVEKLIEKTVHIPQPVLYPVEKIVEKKVPYPVDRIVEKHVPILHPYPVHIKVPQPYPIEKIIPKPYPVETIVEKPVHIHVPVEKIIEKKVPVPQPYPVEVEKIVEKKVPYPVEVTKYIDKPVPIHVPQPYPVEKIVEKTVHVPKPYPVEKIVERIVEKHIRVPYAVEVVRNIPYGVQYGVSYQQIMRPHSHNLYMNHGKTRTPFYGLPVITRHQEFRHPENVHVDSKLQFQGYNYEKPAISFVEGGNSNDQIGSGSQQVQFKHSFNLGKKLNSHVVFPHYSTRRHNVRTISKEKTRNEEYVGPVPPQRSPTLRLHQHSVQNQHAVQVRSPQSSTAATRSPTSTTTLRRAREPEAKPQSNSGNFRQSKVEYGFKPPMIPSVQYDENTGTKVES